LFDFLNQNSNLYVESPDQMLFIYHHTRQLLTGTCLLLLPLFFLGQNTIIDSLEKILKAEKRDSMRSIYFIELASNYSGYDTLKAMQYLELANRINQVNNWHYNRGYYFQCLSNYVYERGDYERSLRLADTAILNFKKMESSNDVAARNAAVFQVAETTMGKGATYSAMGKPEEAIKKYQEALRLFEATKNPLKNGKIATTYNNIATVFFLINQYEKGLEYDLKAIPYHIETKNEEMLAYSYTYVASDYMRLDKYDSARLYFGKAEPLVKRLDKNLVNIEYYGKIGELYWTEGDWKNTRKYYTIAYNNAEEINVVYSEVEYLSGIGSCFYMEKNYIEADKYLQQAKKLAEENNMLGSQYGLYATSAYNYYRLKRYKPAYDNLLYYHRLKDSVAGVALKQKIAEMDELYQSEKKQQEITQLQKEKKIQEISLRQKSLFNYILVGSIATLLIVGFLAYRILRARQLLGRKQEELQRQRISELEKDKQLVAVDSMLRGQEDERSRLAKDLHDGLGGLLSGVKFSLINMKDNLVITPENMAVFERSLDMLDTSIKELRRVAHNMMPEMLVKFGLDEALKEYCNTINATGLINVKYQSFGIEKKPGGSMEIIVYRIVQELLNNILKHASASEAFVQLVKGEDRLSLVIEDNGKGFDTATLADNKGAGWTSIRSRVDYLKGQLEIHSDPQKGTSVYIDFNL
jgi:two-component system NarL family sensor kinase